MPRRYIYLLALLISLMMQTVCPAEDHSTELENAQAMVSAAEYTKAYQEYQRYSDNNPLAQFSLALFHENGWGRKIDQPTACQWYGKAAEGNIPAAAHYYAECLLKGIQGNTNPAGAIKWFQKAIELGYVASYCSIARVYMRGDGVVRDAKKALEYCQQDAGQGLTSAQLQMGLFYLQGDQSIRDIDAATDWFNTAAQNGSAEAAYYNGVIYRDHRQNEYEQIHNDEALYWFETAAGRGYVPAYFQTAHLYFSKPATVKTGKPSATDLAKSYLWLSATAQSSRDENELKDTQEMLNKVMEIMPEIWVEDLDAKVKEHLEMHTHR